MGGSLRKTQSGSKKKSKLIVRLMVPMLLLVILQVATFFGILILGGEFTYVEQYAYSSLVDKTANRKNYIENELQQKMPLVHESADKIGARIADILEEQGATIADIQTDRDLNNLIIESSLESMVELLRRSTANDVYLILETGDLYGDDGGSPNAKAALYLRDLDSLTDGGYSDLLMEVGLISLSRKYGIILDSGWTLHLEADPQDMNSYEFFYQTMQTAREIPMADPTTMGYWSGFSSISRGAAGSMKYTLPLIAEDGTVYGVLGIGLTENTMLANLPASDFMNELACYVVGHQVAMDRYDITAHSGSAFSTLLYGQDQIKQGDELAENVYRFNSLNGRELVGNVQVMNIYDGINPHRGEQWVLISVADKDSVLGPLYNLIRMLVIAAIISVAVSAVIVILSSRMVVRPMTSAVKNMNAIRDFNHVIHFAPTNIDEFDKMTDAITKLQINVQDFSSQVSQMIRIANVGLGTFMYNRADDTVFVGQSLLKQLRVNVDYDEDVMMTRQEFLSSFVAQETRDAVTESLDYLPAAERESEDYIKEFSVAQEDGTLCWMRLSLVQSNNKCIGILQDVTSAMMEKKRIEYERDYDGTTGLLNRRAYYHRLAELFNEKEKLKVAAIIMLDLDNLKYVNDTYGHDFGDDYIKTAANALKRFQDYGGVVSRLSGDEFNVCLSGFSSKEEVRSIIMSVREQLLQSACLLADGTHFKIRASMGIAWYPDDAQTYELLMKYADFAMYTIKHSKKGGFAEFDMSTYTTDSVLLTGVEEMNRIIDERSVRYAFQSIVSARTGEVYGYEALMRPQSSIFQTQLELLRTAKTGAKLYEIERLTWTKALDDFQAQIDAGHIVENGRIFVNSITNCVLDPDDVEKVEQSHPNLLSRVVLEIVEGEEGNGDIAVRKMNRMRKWNAQVALDDFGVNYNSEAVLSTMRPNIVKIDRSIVGGCDKDISRSSIITTLVKLARTKGVLVLAGGVETEEELRTVINCGVDLLQGYFLNRPLYEPEMPTQEVTGMIRRLSGSVKDA